MSTSYTDRQKNRIFQFLIEMPKVELHLHLEGMVSPSTVFKLIEKNSVEIEGIESSEDVYNRFKVNSLDEFVSLYVNVIQPAICTEADFKLLVADAVDYMRRNRIFHVEIFVAVTKFIKAGLSYQRIAGVLHQQSQKIMKENNLSIKFIVDVSRGFGPDNAMHNLDLVIAHKNDSIIGIGLGGAESQGPAQLFESVFKKARENNLHTVAHAGEDVGSESIWAALDILKVERIGHGISAIEDEKLLKELQVRQTPLEICPTSNLFTGKYVKQYQNHMIKEFFFRGLNVTLNSDDPGIFWVELNDEYLNLYEHSGFTIDELTDITMNGLNASFLSIEEKRHHQKKMKQVIERLRYSYRL